MKARCASLLLALVLPLSVSCDGLRRLEHAREGVLLDQRAQLTTADSHTATSYFAHYDVPVHAGDRLVVTLESTAFDPLLQVAGPGGMTLSNDDYQGDRHRSHIELTAQSEGALKVNVSTFGSATTGPYHLEVVRTGSGPVELPARNPNRVAAGSPALALPGQPGRLAFGQELARVGGRQADLHHQLPAGVTGTAIGPGQVVQGNLGASGARLLTGEFGDFYSLPAHAGVPITVEMDSTAVDAFLVAEGPSGERYQNDDSGGSTDALLTLVPAQDCVYRIVATSFRTGESGAYTLKISESRGGAAGTPSGDAPALAAPGAPGAATTRRDGTLAPGDARLRTGEYVDTYDFTLPAGTAVHVEARSTAFDTYLIVRSPSNHQQDNDDGPGGGTNAALDFVTEEAGVWHIAVTSYRAGETGAYQLVLNAPGAAPDAAPTTPTGAAPAPTPIQPTTPEPVAGTGTGAPAREITGTLAAGDAQLPTGEFADSQTLRFTPGQSVRLRLSSSAFDTYLIVRPPSGHQQDNDDLAPGSTNSGVDIPAAEAGDYRVTVTSYRAGETGPYTLRIESGPAGAQPVTPDGTPAPGGGGGRVWGVFAGITNYPAGVNSLPECANDARKMVESLTRRGLITPDHYVLLTDAQVTTGAVRDAMHRMGSQITPDDVFVFFYSGHGGHTDTSHDPRELDGRDEYLYLFDGPLIDDEMGTLFDGIHARISMLALDSCFSGGFDKDVITRPGRIGIFSSEEDVTSDVALSFRAGGYLSHFLQTGIDGEADNDPHDSVLTVGELTHYVWREFGAHAANVREEMGYQQVVIDRGAVGAQQVLWTYRGGP